MTTESADALADWDLFFPDVQPIGYELRTAFPERWARFHSLPHSKRYAENETEYAELLTRHNTILADLARPLEMVKLITAGYSYDTKPIRSYPELVSIDPSAKVWRTVMVDAGDEGDDPFYWHFFVSEWEFRPGAFDSIIRLVANEVVANVMIVASDLRWLLHPYDGGMDVIAANGEELDQLREMYAAWLPSGAGGL